MVTSVTHVSGNQEINQSFIIRLMIGGHLYRLLNHLGRAEIVRNIIVSKRRWGFVGNLT